MDTCQHVVPKMMPPADCCCALNCPATACHHLLAGSWRCLQWRGTTSWRRVHCACCCFSTSPDAEQVYLQSTRTCLHDGGCNNNYSCASHCQTYARGVAEFINMVKYTTSCSLGVCYMDARGGQRVRTSITWHKRLFIDMSHQTGSTGSRSKPHAQLLRCVPTLLTKLFGLTSSCSIPDPGSIPHCT